MSAFENVIRPLDNVQRRAPWLAFPFAVLKKFNDDQGANLASLLAFYGFLSIFPLILMLTTMLGYVLRGNAALQHRILHSALVGFPVIGDQLKTTGLQGNWYVIVITAAISLWGARGVASAAQNAFNSVWNVPFALRPSYGSELARSFGLLTVMAVTVLVTGLLSGVGGASGSLGVLLRIGVFVASSLINIGMFLLGFRLATAREVTLREFALAAFISAIVWQILLTAGTLLVAHQVSHAEALYGTFGVVLGLVAWLRLQAGLTLYAIEADVVRARRLWPRSVAPPPLTSADRRAYHAYAEETRRNLEDLETVERTVPADEEDGDESGDDAARGDSGPGDSAGLNGPEGDERVPKGSVRRL